ncbi:DUF1295 domain-containing protein [Oceanicoccus sagamiensis]|uniref:Steroid 5-alpha reductase C-terminal domain-containing protein n=1 Tax=Oceanicoccus sagamiensis TaxID=716816 RepID=A0A1X9N8E4_9GAMM|nr:DUF1295 domain-containing protein [Oceanicoccus sagamiensis]ARN73354.1 hypothetical protein BST96_04060 [Oceanicoccus sagamiensis]
MEGPLRALMPVCLISSWLLFYWMYNQAVIGPLYLYLLLLSQLICLITFVNFVHVFTFGYAGATLSLNAILLLYYQPPLMASLISIMLMLYGARLMIFQYRRYNNPSYAQTRAAIKDASQAMPFFVKIILWVFTSWNYLFYSLASYFVVSRYPAEGLLELPMALAFGVILMIVDLVMETLADAQKQAFKATSRSFCNIGLYTSCRHPNYLGEIIFVVGVFVAGLDFYQAWYEYLAAAISPFYLFALMVDSARRGDIKKDQQYSSDPAYQEYKKTVPSLWPKFSR